jgi:MscS family membrane protein
MSFPFSFLADAASQVAPVADKVEAAKTAAAVSMNPVVAGKNPYVFGEMAISHEGLLHAAVIIAVAFTISHVVKRVFSFVAERLGSRRPLSGAALIALARSTHLFLFAVTVRTLVPLKDDSGEWHGLVDLSFGNWTRVVDRCAVVLIVVACTMALYHLVRVPVSWFTAYASKTESKLDDVLAPIFDNFLKIFVILGGIIQLISSLTGSAPAQIIAPLAVGGLAVGLAAQDTIKNFFGSVMLIIDKPFTLGELVDIGSHTGVVESLGLRSTRLRSPEGHLVTVPNGDLANRAIRNIGARPNIRQLFSVGLTYDTSPEKLEEAVSIIRALMEDHEGLSPALPPRVHLNNLGAYSIDIQVLYWYHPADWWQFNAYHQKLLLEILRRLGAAGISIAFPSQTIYHRAIGAASESAQGDPGAAASRVK